MAAVYWPRAVPRAAADWASDFDDRPLRAVQVIPAAEAGRIQGDPEEQLAVARRFFRCLRDPKPTLLRAFRHRCLTQDIASGGGEKPR
ncbi:MAG TPA: hypothetical protein VLD65_02790 [Anaerolineales bacterium]|nr:hypothetical protein [Anaerolineales bacterium]